MEKIKIRYYEFFSELLVVFQILVSIFFGQIFSTCIFRQKNAYPNLYANVLTLKLKNAAWEVEPKQRRSPGQISNWKKLKPKQRKNATMFNQRIAQIEQSLRHKDILYKSKELSMKLGELNWKKDFFQGYDIIIIILVYIALLQG